MSQSFSFDAGLSSRHRATLHSPWNMITHWLLDVYPRKSRKCSLLYINQGPCSLLNQINFLYSISGIMQYDLLSFSLSSEFTDVQAVCVLCMFNEIKEPASLVYGFQGKTKFIVHRDSWDTRENIPNEPMTHAMLLIGAYKDASGNLYFLLLNW
jgi:hypothetical protein